MKKIGITGSLASGKTTASKILSSRKGPLFSADSVVRKLYSNNNFKNLIRKKFKIEKKQNIKSTLRKIIISHKNEINKLEKIIHPQVRKEMRKFISQNRKKKFIFLEIPLLIESKLNRNFDVIFFIKTKKSLRLKRFLKKGGNKRFFQILNSKQLDEKRKIKLCDEVILNEKNIKTLKKSLLYAIKKYE